MTDMFNAVDRLLAGEKDLPSPAVRARLRKASGLTQVQVGEALGVRWLAVHTWESGKSEPRGDRRKAYLKLLRGWSERYPEALTSTEQQGE
ncbi:helix-turn-helix domain-containing protein [Streptomyces sp. SGAir0957]